MSKKFLSGINVTGTATLNTVADAGTNTDKFLVLESSGAVSYRTAAELYIDLGIGNLPAGYTSTVKHEVKAGELMSKGQAVYISSSDGTNMIASLASNVSESTSSKTMGLLETSLSLNGKGNVVTEGLVSGINTNGAAYGDPVWLGTNGNLIFGLANKPTAPSHLVFIGIVTRVNSNNGEIFVNVQNGFEMKELHNYAEGSVQNNEVITYEYSTSLYKPKSISTILGYTPADDSFVMHLSGTETVTGYKTFSDTHGIISNYGMLITKGNTPSAITSTEVGVYAESGSNNIVFRDFSSLAKFNFPSGINSYTFPSAISGTIALTSDLSLYVPNSRTLTINGTTYDLTTDRAWTINTSITSTDVTTALGYTPANDSLVVHLSGTETITGYKTFSHPNGVLLNYGALITKGNTPGAITSTDVAIYAESGSSNIVFRDFSSLVKFNFPSAINSYTFPAAISGTIALISDIPSLSGYVPTSRTITINGTAYDLSADRSWSVSANQNARTEYEFTTDGLSATYSVSYTVGQVDVFYNGSKLASTEFTATTGTSVVLGFTPPSGQIIEIVAWETGGGVSSSTTITINGTTYDLSQNRSWNISTGISGSGTANGVAYFSDSSTLASTSNFYWDNTNKWLGIGTNAPSAGITSYSTSAATQFKAAGAAPAITFSNTLTSPTLGASLGLVTAVNNFVNGTIAGELVLVNQSATERSIVFGIGAAEKMRLAPEGCLAIGTTIVSSEGNLFLGAKGTAEGGQLVLQKGTTQTYAAHIDNYTDQFRIISGTNTTSSSVMMSINLANGVSTFTGDLTANGVTIGASDVRSSSGILTLGGTSEAARITGGTFQLGTGTYSPYLKFMSGGSTSYAGVINMDSKNDYLHINGGNSTGYGSGAYITLIGSDRYGTNTAGQLILGAGNAVSNSSYGFIAFETQNNERMRVTAAGLLCIGTTNPYFNTPGLLIGGSGSSYFGVWQDYSGSSVGLEMANNAGTLKIQFFGSTGNYYFAGSNISDRRAKSNIQSIGSGLSIVSQLKPSTFTYDKNPGIIKGGFIAQEVLDVIPEFVTIPDNEKEMMGVDYYGILALAVKAIQEQQVQIEELKARLN